MNTSTQQVVELLPTALVVFQGVLFEDPPYVIIYAAALGTLMTSILIWGFLERKDWTILRMGWDSPSVPVLCLLASQGFIFKAHRSQLFSSSILSIHKLRLVYRKLSKAIRLVLLFILWNMVELA